MRRRLTIDYLRTNVKLLVGLIKQTDKREKTYQESSGAYNANLKNALQTKRNDKGSMPIYQRKSQLSKNTEQHI